MADPNIIFTSHAMVKFQVLAAQGIQLERDMVSNAVKNPDVVSPGYGARIIAQTALDKDKVLRVVYEQVGEDIVIVTFYPGRRSGYE